MTDYNTKETKFFSGFIGLIVLCIMIGLIAKTRSGHVIVYDSIMILIITILLTQANLIAGYIGNISSIWST